MKTKPQRFEDVLEFPCDFTFRIVADADAAVRTLCEATITEVLSRAPLRVDVKPSRKGNYAVYRITAHIETGEQIRQIYGALRGVEGVRTLL